MEELNQVFEIFKILMAQIEASDNPIDFGFRFGNGWPKLVKAYCDLGQKPELWERWRPHLLRFKESFSEAVRRESPNDLSALYIETQIRPSLDTIAQLADEYISGTWKNQ